MSHPAAYTWPVTAFVVAGAVAAVGTLIVAARRHTLVDPAAA